MNPKAPMARRDYPGGPLVPVTTPGFDQDPDDVQAALNRLRDLQVAGDLVAYFAAVLDALAPADRDELVAELAVATDTEIFDWLGGVTVDDLPDVEEAAMLWEPIALTGVPDGIPIQGTLEYTLDSVPEGNVDGVLAWVREGEDREDQQARARAALEVETSAGEGRKGVTVPLRELLRG